MADFPIDVTVDPRPAERGLQRVENRLSRVDNAAINVGRSLVRAFAGIAAGIGGAGAIRTLAGYETQMAAVRAITGATEAQFAALRAEAGRLGTTTEFSARQAGAGMEFLARAGLNTTEVLQATAGALTLATAGVLDLARAADIASNILSGFGFEVDQIARVNDVLAATSTRTNTSVEGLGRSFSFIAPIAAAVGLEFEQVAAAVGILGNAGIQGSRAATGLRAVLRGLVSDTGPARDVLESLGITAEQLDPQIHGLLEPLRLLASRGLSLQETLALFGDEGAAAFAALARGVDDVEDLERALGDVEGEGERLAEVMRNQLGGAFQGLGSAIEGLIIQVGEQGLTNAVRTAVDASTRLFRSLAEDGERVRRIMEGIVYVLGGLMVRAILRHLIPAIVALRGAITALTWSNFITGTAQALFVAAVAIYAFVDDIESRLRGMVQAFTNFLDPILASFLALGAAIEAFFSGLLRRVILHARRLGTFFYNNFTEALNRLPFFDFEPLRNQGLTAGTTLGEEVVEAFKAQLDRTPLANILEDYLPRPRIVGAEAGPTGNVGLLGSRSPGHTREVDSTRLGVGSDDDEDAATRRVATLGDILDGLREERELIKLSSDERERRIRLLQIEDSLERGLTTLEEQTIDTILERNQALEVRYGILEQIREPQEKLVEQLEQIDIILGGGIENLQLTNEELEKLRDLRAELAGDEREFTFFETLDAQLNETFGKLDNLNESISNRIVQTIQNMSAGIASALTDAITGVQSLGDALRNIAASAVRALINQLIQAVVQALILKAIFAAFGAGPGGSFSELFLGALTGKDGGFVPRFQTGGLVFGPGGPREDRVLARLSPGEFVVNERATRRNREELERINRGDTTRERRQPRVILNVYTPDADSFRRSDRQVIRAIGRGTELALGRER